MFQKPKYWWVNHKQTHRQELEGEYLWSPKKNQKGAKNVSYDNMVHLMPGDVVFSFADGAIRAIGVAIGRAREALKPPEFGSAGDQWGTDPFHPFSPFAAAPFASDRHGKYRDSQSDGQRPQ
jgi:putative restriction endonuclease